MNNWFSVSVDRKRGIKVDIDFNKTWRKDSYLVLGDQDSGNESKQVKIAEFELTFDFDQCKILNVNLDFINNNKDIVLEHIMLAHGEEQVKRAKKSYTDYIDTVIEMVYSRLRRDFYSFLNDRINELMDYIFDYLDENYLDIATMNRECGLVIQNHFYPYSVISCKQELPAYLTTKDRVAQKEVVGTIISNSMNDSDYCGVAKHYSIDELSAFVL